MSADEMFKKLGYFKFYSNGDVTRYSDEHNTIIEFYNGKKVFDKSVYCITMKELQAINKKVEELGWI